MELKNYMLNNTKWLAKATYLECWLFIEGFEDKLAYCQIGGELIFQVFDSGVFTKKELLKTILEEFPDDKSISDYGCGTGRINQSKVNYLRNFDRNINALDLKEVKSKTLNTSHNSLKYPTFLCTSKRKVKKC